MLARVVNVYHTLKL